jgi:photosystem II stability/assembly factor-like uncharacterized protein
LTQAPRTNRALVTLALAAAVPAALVLAVPVVAQRAHSVDPARFAELHWRMIGPFRGGRSVGVSGVAGDGRTFYFGAVGGGVWKTENAGRTWKPIMDAQPVSSIGAIAVAPSNAKIVYVGSGEADMRSDIIHGNGMYRSDDAGASWMRIGLEDSRQIGRILVDPTDARTLLVAALGHAYGPNEMRGVYRSANGGETWTRTLFHDAETGAIDLASDPAQRVVFASLWQTRRPPWSVYPPSNGPGSGLYKSSDGGVTWNPVRGGGFPSEALGKIGIAIAPSNPNRVYAIVDAKAGGLYRSDDGGTTWRLADKDPRIWERGWYFCHVSVDPKNAEVVYVSDTSFYRSTDGGEHFTAIKGSPSGDDFHQLWIDPTDPARMALASDQGTSVSVDGGVTWSSWLNQPTGQFYHVANDNAFPYHLFGAQQDSGAVMIVSRSDHRGIQDRDWRPIASGGESGYVLPDPRDNNLVYGGVVVREDLRSNQTRSLSPTVGRPGPWRDEWTLPVAFGADHALYFGRQFVFRSKDDGNHWERVSGDLARRQAGIPATLDTATAADVESPEPRGVVYAIAPSPLRANVVWAGTDDGLVYVTNDGAKTWRAVTPPAVTAWSHVDGIEASHFDDRSAYLAVDRHRLDDDHSYIYVTHDAGRTWREASAGIPDGSFVNAVREDPVRRGLLYAATETGVYISFDDAVSWQSLRLNMPVVSVRDISVHNGDLAVATHGRAFWILDDVLPLRELALDGVGAAAGSARLFSPRDAFRTRPGNDEAEDSPPETPVGENPTNGAFIDYIVPPDARNPVVLISILDAHGNSIRRWFSTDSATPVDPNRFAFPAYWIVPVASPSAQPGVHRFVWDLRERRADGPWAPPGAYTVSYAVVGDASSPSSGPPITRRLVLHRDPRAAASDADLVAQAALAREIDTLLVRVRAAMTNSSGDKLTALRGYAALLSAFFRSVESADAAPTANERAVWQSLRKQPLKGLPAPNQNGSDDDA